MLSVCVSGEAHWAPVLCQALYWPLRMCDEKDKGLAVGVSILVEGEEWRGDWC